ncbi:hypothetical protein DV451_003236 [Geotrichum candidum]|uniref:Alpha-1,3-glucosyltransferase n=1 Tax=Geotrichum candidum TaxID=1173061 RepID=A0A9P5G4Q0_GEOCN|nr:hypothetical protein DV451_003236 [Geotrichum candidum]KAF5109946.1 hypothetical protein DV453_001237 [Geotrichum candidum]
MTKTKLDQSSSSTPSLKNIFIAATFLKVLLFGAYHSTDFEVHRNWLAITNKLPVREWYTEKTSQWTLDYPPFFALFEYVLSLFVPAVVRADGALDIVEQGTYGWPTIVFQRTTVIVSELVLLGSLQWYIATTKDQSSGSTNDRQARLRAFSIAGSIFLSPGLLIIDHIHFQYNGFMYGILIYSLIAARNQKLLLSGFLFAVLLCFKHIYLYLAPAYFAYLLRVYVLKSVPPTNTKKRQNFGIWPVVGIDWNRTLKLGTAVVGTFVVAFGPFVYYGKQYDLLSRLFPFSRGLTHAYWAPNVWAIYSFIDRAGSFFSKTGATISSTRGIVGDVSFAILPEISPKLTFILTLFYQVLALIPLFLWPTFPRFIAAVTLCGYSSFLFGWHVHEKAILLVIFPFSFLALRDSRLLSTFVPLSVSGYLSLFPLLFTSGETLIKSLYTFVWFVMFHLSFKNLVKVRAYQKHIFLLDRAVLIYMVGFVPLMASSFILDRIAGGKYEFAYLMAVSVYCAVGVIGSWASFSWLYFFDEELWA